MVKVAALLVSEPKALLNTARYSVRFVALPTCGSVSVTVFAVGLPLILANVLPRFVLICH
jgi:hypothetical protein